VSGSKSAATLFPIVEIYIWWIAELKSKNQQSKAKGLLKEI
jgi:hypothetical protein